MIFDFKTIRGWESGFFKKKIHFKHSDSFQRIWIHNLDKKRSVVNFDIFIRERNKKNKWKEWKRGIMTERLWKVKEVVDTIKKINNVFEIQFYNQNFKTIPLPSEKEELIYVILKKKSV